MRVLLALAACGLLLAPGIPAPAAAPAESEERTYCDVALEECRLRCGGSPAVAMTAGFLGIVSPSVTTFYTFLVRGCTDGCVLKYQECFTRYQAATDNPV